MSDCDTVRRITGPTLEVLGVYRKVSAEKPFDPFAAVAGHAERRARREVVTVLRRQTNL